MLPFRQKWASAALLTHTHTHTHTHSAWRTRSFLSPSPSPSRLSLLLPAKSPQTCQSCRRRRRESCGKRSGASNPGRCFPPRFRSDPPRPAHANSFSIHYICHTSLIFCACSCVDREIRIMIMIIIMVIIIILVPLEFRPG